MNEAQPRRWGVALALVAIAAFALASALLQGFSIKPAYARPLPAGLGPLASGLAGSPNTSAPAWQVLPAGAGDAVIPTGRPSVQVPILMYHYIRDLPNPSSDHLGWALSTSPADFRRQLDYLDDHGYHPVTLTDLRAYLAGQRSLPDRPVVLTFDDGYADFYKVAYPILRQHDFRAVAYIVSGFVGWSGRYLLPDQVRELDANGIEIGAHTVNHVDLTRAGSSLWSEVKGSKDALEALVGHPVLDFCYPAGREDATVVAAVKAAGFASATTTASGALHSLDDRYTWTRIRVSGGESLSDFAAGLEVHETGRAPSYISTIVIPRAYPLIFLRPWPGSE